MCFVRYGEESEAEFFGESDRLVVPHRLDVDDIESAAYGTDENTKLASRSVLIHLSFGPPCNTVSGYPPRTMMGSMNLHQSSTSDRFSTGILAPLNRTA